MAYVCVVDITNNPGKHHEPHICLAREGRFPNTTVNLFVTPYLYGTGEMRQPRAHGA